MPGSLLHRWQTSSMNFWHAIASKIWLAEMQNIKFRTPPGRQWTKILQFKAKRKTLEPLKFQGFFMVAGDEFEPPTSGLWAATGSSILWFQVLSDPFRSRKLPNPGGRMLPAPLGFFPFWVKLWVKVATRYQKFVAIRQNTPTEAQGQKNNGLLVINYIQNDWFIEAHSNKLLAFSSVHHMCRTPRSPAPPPQRCGRPGGWWRDGGRSGSRCGPPAGGGWPAGAAARW